MRGGPRPVRSRAQVWGLYGLSPFEYERVKEANQLWINTMAIAEMVSARGGGHLIEHPGDPGEEPVPSLWITPEMINMETRTGARRAHTHQCPYGGIAPKYIILSGTLVDLESMDQTWCPGISASHRH